MSIDDAERLAIITCFGVAVVLLTALLLWIG